MTRTVALQGHSVGSSSLVATPRIRYSFAPQMVAGAILFARQAKTLEESPSPTPQDVATHRAYVVSAVLQAAAAIETEQNEVFDHGPRHHLGGSTSPAELAQLDVLGKKREKMRNASVVDRWNRLLTFLGRQPLDPEGTLYKDIELLAHLRNEIVHYHSKDEGATAKPDLFARLSARGLVLHLPPPFASATRFPHGIVNARCAHWCASTAVTCMDELGERLGVDSILAAHRLPGADLAPILGEIATPSPRA